MASTNCLFQARLLEQSDLSSHYGIACGQIDILCKKLTPDGSVLVLRTLYYKATFQS